MEENDFIATSRCVIAPSYFIHIKVNNVAMHVCSKKRWSKIFMILYFLVSQLFEMCVDGRFSKIRSHLILSWSIKLLTMHLPAMVLVISRPVYRMSCSYSILTP